MKRTIVSWGVLLIIALVLTEAHSFLYKLNSELASKELNLFIIKHQFPISLEWYVKTTCDSLLIIILSFVAAKVSYQFSFKLFRIFCVCFVYGILDLFLFWLNYKASPYPFYLLLAAIISSISFLVFEKEKRISKYKSLT